jgi:hypothetical protein
MARITLPPVALAPLTAVAGTRAGAGFRGCRHGGEE